MKVTTIVQPVRASARPPKRKDVVAWLEANWRAAWVGTAGGMRDAEIEPIHRGLLVRTGLPLSFFNAAFVDAACRRPDRAVAAAESFFAGLPFSVVVPDTTVELAAACEAAGLWCVETLPGMALTPIPDVTLDPGLTIEPLTNRLLPAFRDVFGRSFELSPEMVARLVTDDYVAVEGMYDVIAYAGPEPVAVATTVEAMGVAGVYNVGTPPEHRGNGYGEAVTWSVIRAAKERGCHTAILQSTEMGFGVYRRMGFETVQTYRFYTNDPRP